MSIPKTETNQIADNNAIRSLTIQATTKVFQFEPIPKITEPKRKNQFSICGQAKSSLEYNINQRVS